MIKVLLERHCQENKAAEFHNLLGNLRSAAMGQPGYYSGETLCSSDDPSKYLIISTWSTKEAWQTWQNTPLRREITNEIEPLLTEPTKVSIFQSLY
jgi:heme-degrading monooxygenase HmoA